jgi:short-subunit dehydrogenase
VFWYLRKKPNSQRKTAGARSRLCFEDGFLKALRIELKPKGITVLASAPGPVRSGFAARANMAMGAAVLPEVVARQSLNSLGKKGTVIPGALSKLLTYSLLPLPRFLRSLIMGQVMGQMTKHQNAGAHT